MRTRTWFVSFPDLITREGAATVVKVAMVCNDLALANSSMRPLGGLRDHLNHIRRGGGMYFTRLSCGHLSEGIVAIAEIDSSSTLRSFVDRCSQDAQAAFADLGECLRGKKQSDTFKRLVGWVRNRVVFHYDINDLRWALEYKSGRKGSTTSSLTDAGNVHESRFEFVDDLLDAIVCRKFWGIPDSADLSAEADRLADWCFQKTLRFLEFGQDFVPRFLQQSDVLK